MERQVFDFRSDTVTLPTAGMMAAIAAAEVGDAARGDDPTVNRLEAEAARIAGKEAAVFTPSGTMANLAAVLVHVRPGQEVILEARAHMYNSESGAMSAVAGAVPRPVAGEDGVLEPAAVAAAIRRGGSMHNAPTALLCLENTHNSAGGVVVPLERMAALHAVAKDAGLPVHLDGARLFNAAVYEDRPLAELCRYADTVMLALSKGIGAPVGSILAGPRDLVQAARHKVRLLGGHMRQAGLIAAAALVALAEYRPVLERDHAMARRLAERLAALDPSLVRTDRVHTNIVNCQLDRFVADAAPFVAALRAQGVLANFAGAKVRFVTHRHIDEAAVDACGEAAAAALLTVRHAA